MLETIFPFKHAQSAASILEEGGGGVGGGGHEVKSLQQPIRVEVVCLVQPQSMVHLLAFFLVVLPASYLPIT